MTTIMATIVYTRRLSDHRHDYLDPPEEQDAYHRDVVDLIKHLIFDGLIYPNDIAIALKEPKKSLAYSIRRTCNQLWSEFLYDYVFIKCANPKCNDSAFYNKSTQRYTDYCCNSCKVSHKVNDPNGPYVANQKKFGDFMQSDEGRKRQSDIMIERFKDPHKRSEQIKKLNSYRCLHIIFEGLRCESSLELYFLQQINLLNLPLPTRPTYIVTPDGWYFPDFEYKDHYVEVKCNFSLKRSTRNGQMKKIEWVSKNIKPVMIVNLDEWYIEDYIREVSRRGFKLELV